MLRLATLFALLATLATAACGESAEEKAQASVCNARDDISEQVDDLKSLTPATFSADAVSEDLQSIRSDLSEIKDAQSDLADDRRQEVQNANQQFAGQVEDVVKQIGRSVTASDAADQITASLQQLAAGYEQAFSRVDCS